MILRTLLSLLVSTLVFSTSFAEKMNYENHSLVINKLNTALSLMKKNDVSLRPTTKRLADLYSERARLAEYQENEKNCNNCMKSFEDRIVAIKHYNSVMAMGLENGAIITQIAHLYQLTNQEHKSNALYNRIIKKSTPTYSSSLVGESHLAVAYNYFKKDNSKKALKHFEASKKFKVKQPQSVTNYYIAWCKFNLGQESVARSLMEKSLKSAIIEAKSSDEMLDFAKQASRDLTTFYARTKLTTNRINKLLDLTPESVRISNFKALADEVERLGKHKSTAKIWGLIAKVTKEPTAKIEAQFRYAKSSLNVGNIKTAASQYDQAITIWQKQSCVTSEDFDCKELKIHVRNFVISWNNTEKSKPSKHLLSAYQSYLRLFGDDNEMIQWAAQVAVIRNNHLTAKNLYRRLTNNKLNAGSSVERSLLAEVEAVENTSSNKEKLDTYNYYLKVNPNGKKNASVRYQLAQTHYEMKNYVTASNIFCDLASNTKTKVSLKSAHLCVDTFAVRKDSLNVEKYSLKFSRMYKTDKKAFMTIARNATLNSVASQLSGKASRRELSKNLTRLENVNLVGATNDDKIKIYKNIINVSEQLNNIPKAMTATNVLLKARGLSAKDKTYALTKKVWFSELLLNFKTALNTYKVLNPVRSASRSQLVRMSVLSELAGLNPSQYDKKILAKTKGTYQSNKIRAKLILASRRPWTEFNKYSSKLKKSKKLYSTVALEIYSKYKNNGQIKKVLKNKFVKYSANGQRLLRVDNLKSINSLKSKVRKHKISSRNNNVLSKSLNRRISLISQLETAYADAAKDKDWLSQAVALEIISFEYHRLYNRILKFPAPRGLKKNELVQYTALLNQQAQPYNKKSETAKFKAARFWNQNKLFTNLVAEHNNAKRSIQKMITSEIKEVSRYAPNSTRQILASARKTSTPSSKEIKSNYEKLRSQPFNRNQIAKVINLETRRERPVVSTYLSERLKVSEKRSRN